MHCILIFYINNLYLIINPIHIITYYDMMYYAITNYATTNMNISI